ncbi:MAG: hypothetical protein P9X22_06845 [Candidatus Zapsychrus exili]|nr:hypothetical protein [Candidatus Zapsychrus exili]
MKEGSRTKHVIAELAEHFPYSVMGVLFSIIVMGILTFIAKTVGSSDALPSVSEELFHIFHPAHVFFSAVATTSMFWRHDNKNIFKAIAIGLIGSIGICGISDIFFPFIGGSILGIHMHLHICILEDPSLILSFAVVGVLSGILVAKSIDKSTQYSHSVHIFLSSMASLLYLISFGMIDWMHAIVPVFFVTVFAVVLPCCLSDIVFPILCTHKHCSCN